MELYDLMQNISKNNIEEKLVQSILIVKEKLKGLTLERMCKVYTSYLLRELLNHHISSRLINTLDLGLDYEHFFILANSISGGVLFVRFNLPSI